MIWFGIFLLWTRARIHQRRSRIRVAPEFHSPNSATYFISQPSETQRTPGAAGPSQANPGCKKSGEEPREQNSAGCNPISLHWGQPSPAQSRRFRRARRSGRPVTERLQTASSKQGSQLGSRLGRRVGGIGEAQVHATMKEPFPAKPEPAI